MASKKISDAEIERIVESFFRRETAYGAFEELIPAGKRATPFLVKALKETKRVTARFVGVESFALVSSPLDHICKAVSRDHLPEIVEPLTALLQHDDEEVRKQVVLALGVLASEKCTVPVLKALRDGNEDIVSYALIGISRAVSREKFDAAFMSEVFPALHDLIRKKDAERGNKTAKLMLAIDFDRAVASLTAADVLVADNRLADEVLKALYDANVIIAHERLLPFLRDVKPRATARPF